MGFEWVILDATLYNIQQQDVLDDFVPLLEGLIRFF